MPTLECFFVGGENIDEIKFYNLFLAQTVVQIKEKLYNICSCSGSLAGAGFVLVRSFCPGVRSGWHLSELDRCFFCYRGEFGRRFFDVN